jgi:hypothetical protein
LAQWKLKTAPVRVMQATRFPQIPELNLMLIGALLGRHYCCGII